MRHDDLDDAALLAALRDQPEAFAALYRRYERPVLGYLLRRTRAPEAAADLAAETFAAALEALRRDAGPRDPAACAAWLFGIARHKLADSARRGRVEEDARRRLAMERLALTDADLERIEALTGDELVAALPADQRAAVLARIVDERDYEEIAGTLETSALVIRKRVSRGLATLRARLEEGR
ncbi:MAG TPA: sigma-70 family RNA polymerase sigma factor [Baekduia sp.]|uniref:RNA polymerase sigma factor n=1 Tax=Baekduia sp. TaxID=2600305 RepID=UPI002D765710|nr:sigma-70 family RNA polymerase sigma factor [Baekduia sp.]HET6505681.1 sigma-70 family RNA polymerase sigma factor [Baekduia sp.]